MPNPPNTDQAIQQFLDALSQLPGSVLYRDMLEWKALAPGAQGEVLAMASTGLPAWSVRPTYFPAQMNFNGTNQNYDLANVAITNNGWTIVARFRAAQINAARGIFTLQVGANWTHQLWLDNTGSLRVNGTNNAGATCLSLATSIRQDTNTLKNVFVSYNRNTGAAVFMVNGQNADNPAYPGRVAIAATLAASAVARVRIGARPGPSNYLTGQIGYVGFHERSDIAWSDFQYTNGWPKPIDTTGWSQWLTQPKVWHPSGKLDENFGTYGALTNNNAVTLANPLTWSS